MDTNNTFSYRYSAKENAEICAIRNKYIPKEENKLDELRRLDSLVQASGTAESLIIGIIGCLIFGAGMCMAMDVLAGGMITGVLMGMTGAAVMLGAYPVYRKVYKKTKAKLSPRILELTEELTK